jgi:hypothetical protein
MNLIANEKQLKNDASAYLIYQKLKDVLHDDTDAILYYNFPIYKGDITEDNVVAKLVPTDSWQVSQVPVKKSMCLVLGLWTMHLIPLEVHEHYIRNNFH